jgi:ABC-type uncharacterized transport system substrate-binding protein
LRRSKRLNLIDPAIKQLGPVSIHHQHEDCALHGPRSAASTGRPRRRGDRMNRRVFIALAGGAFAWPIAGFSQQAGTIPTLGVLMISTPSAPHYQSFLRGLQDHGWIDGHNIRLEFRRSSTIDQLSQLAAELVGMRVDVIFAGRSTLVEPAQRATKTIPIVSASHADPVATGHVASLSHPGGNITGLSSLSSELTAKRLEVLKEALPGIRTIGVLWNATVPPSVFIAQRAANEAAAKSLDIRLHWDAVRTSDEFEGALSMLVRASVDALLVAPSPLFLNERARSADLVVKHGLPAMFALSDNAQAGGLMSYGADLNDLYLRAAGYVDKILRGANPGDLPIEQPTKFNLVLNLKTAKTLGLTFLPTVLDRADEVIE